MIGLSKEELAALIGEMEEKTKAWYASHGPEEPLGSALADLQTGMLERVARLILENNQCLHEDLIALGVLGKDNDL